MALILNIDTATEHASVCLNNGSEISALKENAIQKEHASFIHGAIKEVMSTAGRKLKDIDAISVTAGPGSYTGLRVGLTTAKGLCYALGKPLITISTLEVMTNAAIKTLNHQETNQMLFCPMIDARRMEVFTALYNSSLETILKPCAMIADTSSFNKWLNEKTIMFFGSGSLKFQSVLIHANAKFIAIQHNASDLTAIASKAFGQKSFSNLAYSEPLYLKDTHQLSITALTYYT